MASALASQLAGIRSVNAARIATLGSSAGAQHTASYLFPPRTAAAQDLATVHALARTGLEELAAHDRWFETSDWARDTVGAGRELLFGESSKTRDRSILTKDENAKVDESLARFLARIAHDITGRSAAKCIEWLVRRFRINEFNVPALLGAFLPFHTTPQFARILKICKVEQHPYLAFLQPCQKQETPLPTPLLISSLLASPNLSTSNELLRWLTGLILVPKAAGHQPHRTLVSFWAATLIQFSLRWADMGENGGASLGTASHNRGGKRRGLENRLDDAQIHLNLILPIAVRCAALVPGEENTELRTAALMVIAALGTCFPFSSEAVRATIGSLVGPTRADPAAADEQVIMPLLSACIALFTHAVSDDEFVSPLLRLDRTEQEQEAARLISSDTAQILLGLPRFAESVIEANERGTDVKPFVHELLASLSSSGSGELKASTSAQTTENLSKILLAPAIDSKICEDAARYLLTVHLEADSDRSKHVFRLRLLGDIREQQPQIFDDAVKSVNAGVGEDKTAEESLWKVLKAVITRDFSGADLDSTLEDDTTTLWLTVHSPSPTQRVLAVRSLYATIANGSLPENDTFVVNALEARIAALTETDAAVLSAVYADPDRLLAVLGSAKVAELVLSALDADGMGASLSRQAVDVHLRFLLEHILPRGDALLHGLVPRFVREVLWGRLLLTKAARKTVDAVASALRKATLPEFPAGGKDPSIAWNQILYAIVAELKALRGVASSDQDDGHRAHNQRIAEAVAVEVARIKDVKQLDEMLAFLTAKVNAASSATSPSATQASARVLSLQVLARLTALLDTSRVALLADRVAFGIRLDALPEAALEDHVDDLKDDEDASGGLSDAIHSRPGHERTFRRLTAVLLHRLFAVLPPHSDSESQDDESLLPIGSTARPVLVGIRLYAFLASKGHFGPLTSSVLKQRLFDTLGESVLTFLATIWTASSDTVLPNVLRGVLKADSSDDAFAVLSTKTAALLDAQGVLRAGLVRESDGLTKVQDYQTVVPALLLALQDDFKEVRQAALKPLEIIASAQERAAKSKVEFAEYGYDVVYGLSSKDLVYLHYADVCKYLRTLLEEKDSFVNDQQNLAIWHATALSVKKSDKRKEAEYKQAIVAFLLAHVVAWPSVLAGIGLLESLRDLPHATKLRSLVPVLRRYVDNTDAISTVDIGSGTTAEDQQRFVALMFGAYDISAPNVVEDKTNGSWALLLGALSSSSDFVRICACKAISGPFFKALRPDMAQELLQHIVNVLNEASTSSTSHLRQCLRDLPAPSSIFGPILAQLRIKLAGNLERDGREAKRARTSVPSEDTQLRAASTLAVLLETVAARNIKGASVLVGELFEILRTTVEISGSTTVNTDHLMQLTMAALMQALSASESSVQVLQSIRVDTIINTIKVSQNPQTFQQALTLLNRIATINQELVLHNVMPIFTFVGSAMLQRDDSYSFEIVQQTLQSIIPAYVQTLRSAVQAQAGHFDLLRQGRSFMRIFTDAAMHIPRHRRQTFFKSLLDVLGPADFLAAICMLLTDRSAHKVAKQTPEAFAESIALPLSLLSSFPVDKQVGAIEQVFAEMERLWEHRSVSTLEARDAVFLDRMDRAVREHSDRRAGPTQQLCALMRLVIAATSASGFKTRLPKVKKAEARAVIDRQLEACVHKTLKLAVVDDVEVRGVSNEVLETLLQHISAEGFMRLVAVLVTDQSPTTRRTGLALFSTRFAIMSVEEKAASEGKVLPVLEVAAKSVSVASTATQQPAELPEALASIKSATSAKLTTLHPVLVATVPDLIKLGQVASLTPVLRIEVLTSISRVVRVIGPRLIPQLASIVTFALSILAQGVNAGSGAVLAAAFGILTGLMVTLPTFMVSHVQTILAALVDASLLDALEQPGFDSAERPLNTLYDALVKAVAVEKVLEALQKLWTTHSQAGNFSSLVSVVDCLRRVILRLDRPAIAAIYKNLFRFFLKIFDTRRVHASKLSAGDVDEIEEAAVQAFIEMALQLNESAFRPLFYHIFDWAVLELAEDQKAVSDQGLRSRRILLFKLVNTLLLQLRGLFTTYYATVLDHTIELLTAFAAGELEDNILWNEVLTSVELTCQFDEGNFWNPTRLSKISASLIGQVQVCTGGSSGGAEPDDDAEDRIGLLASAVASLAQTVSDEDSLKELNDGLLRKTRSGTSSVKAASLAVLDELWRTQAEGMQPFVAQTTPFLAELLDSDDADVLQRTNQLVQTIEGILGEPLDSYLT